MEEDISESVARIVDYVHKDTKNESVGAVQLALGMVAARRSRRAGGTKDDFLKDMATAWNASVEG